MLKLFLLIKEKVDEFKNIINASNNKSNLFYKKCYYVANSFIYIIEKK